VTAVPKKDADLLVHNHMSMASYQQPYVPLDVREVADDHPFQRDP
jgi:hypothetical protein